MKTIKSFGTPPAFNARQQADIVNVFEAETGRDIAVDGAKLDTLKTRSVASIADLSSVDTAVYDSVIVKDKDRGGVFTYDASRALENDGGVVFDGWVRQYSGAVYLKWFGTLSDRTIIQNAINTAYNSTLIFETKTYMPQEGFTIVNPITIDLNNCVINQNTTYFSSIFTILADNVIIKNGELNVADADSSYAGQGGTAGACVGAGNQNTGVGYKGMTLEDLTLSWNREDGNGGAISIIGSTNNALLRNITIKENIGAVGNVIGVEWGGLPNQGATGHPHNITIDNLIVGDLPNQINDRYLVWLSASFNIKLNNINCNQCAGGVIVIAGDNGNEFAPESYRQSVGSNISISNLSVNKIRHTGVRIVGDATPVSVPYSNNVKVSNSVITGDSSATSPVGILVEYSSGATIDNCKIKACYFGINVNVGAKKNIISNCYVTESRYSGITIGSASGGCEDNIITNCKLTMNSKLSTAITHSGVYTYESKNTTINNCVFGEIGAIETTKYQIGVGANQKKVNINNNYINSISSGGIGIYTGTSSDTDILPNGSGNYGEVGFTLFGGLPIREIHGNGNISYIDTAPPTAGNYLQGDRVIRSDQSVGGVKSWVCTVSGSAGTWVSEGTL